MKYSTSVLVITLISAVSAQQGYYGLGQGYYQGLSYPYNIAGLSQQPQYVTSSQQQHLINLAQQQQRLLAMSQLNKPQQMMYTQIAGLNAVRPKWPVYKPQYAYTKAIQSFIRPQKPVGKTPNIVPNNFIKMPVSYAYSFPSMAFKNTTKPMAISTFNHIVKPNPVYMPAVQNLISGQTQSHKYLTSQPLKYTGTQMFNSFPSAATLKPASVPYKNYLSLQSPKNTLSLQNPKLSHQYPKNTLSFQSPGNSLTLQSPQTALNYQPAKTVLSLQSPKNILTLQTPNNLAPSQSNLHKNSINSQTYAPSSNTNYYNTVTNHVPQNTQRPPTYSTFLGNTLVKNEPSENYHSSGPGVSYSNQVLKPTGSKTILTPVKSEGERGPIYTIPAPNLSLGDKTNYKAAIQQSPIYTYQVPKLQPSYEVTEPSTEKTYQDATQQSLQYASQFSSTLLKNPTQQFSPMIPNTQTYHNQQPSQTLSTQEFYDLLNGVEPQQQLPDTYSMPLLQQPQLQQHFMQQTLGVSAPLQPFNAIIQPIYSNGDTVHDKILFKPDATYVQKIQDQYLHQGSAVQPAYQISSDSPTAEALKAEIEALVQQHDSSNVHYNIIRNAQEGSLATNDNERNGKNDKNSNHISSVDKNNNAFVPTAIPETDKELTMSKPVVASYYTQVSGPDNSVSNYFSPLTNKEVEETLATIQAASNLMKTAKGKNSTLNDSSYASSGFQPYFAQNSQPNQYQFISQTNNAFTPIKSSSMTVTDDDEQNSGNKTPIRIYVPDQYDDIETQSSQDINMSASINTQENDNEQNIVGSYDTVDTEQNNQQEYADYSQVPENETNGAVDNVEYTTLSSEVPSHPEDVIVLLQRNNTDPSLDIVTKDWKTSIVIKAKDKERANYAEPNQLDNDFGNRLRPKRNQ